MEYLLITLMMMLFLNVVVYADISTISDEVNYNGVNFCASLSKSTYYDGEPIILTVSLTNKRESNLILPDLINGSYCGTTLNISINPTPKSYFKTTKCFSFNDTLWEFKPGEKHTIEIDSEHVKHFETSLLFN